MKVLLFFFDGAPFGLVQQWVQEGKLPFLAKLQKMGISGKTKSTVPPITPVAVISMYTGKNAGKTGISARTDASGDLISASHVREKAFWDYLSEAGYSSLIYYVPMTYPPKPLRGTMVCGYGAPLDAKDFVCPKNIPYYNELVTQEEEKNVLPNKGLPQFLDDICYLTERRFTTLAKLEKRQHFDFTLFFLPDSDRLQHFCFADKKLLLKYYQFVDRKLGELTSRVKYDTIFISTDHGFEPSAQRKFSPNTWLAEQEYLVFYGGTWGKHFFLSLYDFVIKHIPLSSIIRLRNFLKKQKKEDHKPQRMQQAGRLIPGVNWKKTKAYTDCEWGIRLTEHATQQDKEVLLKRLAALYDNGLPVCRFVAPREQFFSGQFIHRLPNIVFLPRSGLESFLTLARRSLQDKALQDYKFSQGHKIEGMHDYDQNGLFFAAGLGISKGKSRDCSIMDFFPTILSLFDVKLPKDIDGQMILGSRRF